MNDDNNATVSPSRPLICSTAAVGENAIAEEHLFHALRLVFEGTETDRRMYLMRMARRYPFLSELNQKYPYSASVLR